MFNCLKMLIGASHSDNNDLTRQENFPDGVQLRFDKIIRLFVENFNDYLEIKSITLSCELSGTFSHCYVWFCAELTLMNGQDRQSDLSEHIATLLLKKWNRKIN